MAHDSFEVSNENPTNTGHPKKEKTKGCFISLPVGFVLLLLAVLIAVGVGIIVLFAAGGWKVVCSCQSSGTGPRTGDLTAQQIRQECINLTKNGDPEICGACAAVNTTVTSTPTSLTTTTPTPPVVTGYRLPTSVSPDHYDIELQPYMHDYDTAKFTFKGRVKILVNCHTATNTITLHADVLTVDTSSIRLYPQTSPSSEVFNYVSSEVDKERQFFIVRLDRNLEVGQKYWIEMSFTSPLLKGDTLGLYYSSYQRDTDNKTVYLATTQFEPTYARRAFPCFDEPAMKATFTITLVRPDELRSLSNMPIANSNTKFKENGITYVKDVYQKTVKMSTYLLAFVVCDYGFLSKITKNNVKVSTWAKPQSVNATRYALDVGVNITEFFEDYFEIKYPLPKQDMIAIPHFHFGAMENWGLITYKEAAMLYEDKFSSQYIKRYVARIVSHELAHQWFGNLVTMSWWNDSFLNEAFATLVSYLGVHHAHPDWRMLEMFPVEEMHPALWSDSEVVSRPVYVQVQNPQEIRASFNDRITYKKGGSIIRMMRMFLGEETFKQGIIKYLKTFSYKTVSHDDLWEAMSEQLASEGRKIEVKEIMDTWILQMNYPVVTVTRDFSNLHMLHVSQERFLADPKAVDPGTYTSPYNYRWSIPLTFTSSSHLQFTQHHNDVQWIYKEERTKTLDANIPLPNSSNRDGWILANVRQYGFYRVNYQLGNWQALARQLQKNLSVIAPENRAQLIDDASHLVRAGFLQENISLELIEYIDKERDYIPLIAASNVIERFDNMLLNTPYYQLFQSFMRSKLKEPFKHFGMERISQDPVDVLSQSLVAKIACKYQVQECLDQAKRLYKLWMANPSQNMMDPNIREVVLKTGIEQGGAGEWEFALEMAMKTDSQTELNDLLLAMASSRDASILSRFLNILGDKNSTFPDMSKRFAISAISQNSIGKPLVEQFYRNKNDVLKPSFPELMSTTAARTSTDDTDVVLEKAISNSTGDSEYFPKNERTLDQARETVDSNKGWMSQRISDIAAWLEERQQF